MQKIQTLADALTEGQTSSRDLVDACLDQIEREDGEGARAFIAVDAEGARLRAEEMDQLRRVGQASSPYAGIPISLKDLFDIEGQVTRAGSRLLDGAAPATADAVVVDRLRRAGFIFMGRTNMTEFAYSGLGLNPHYGTPLSPYDRKTGHIPGGSSSGAAVSVADGMAVAGIGTDTGGSCRIPAAFCGIVGFKPTARRVDTAGAFPLSHSLDSIGPLARSVDCCAILDSILAGEAVAPLPDVALRGKRFGILRNFVLEQMDPIVASAFERVLKVVEKAGATLVDLTLPDLDLLPERNARGGIVAAEAYAVHKTALAQQFDDFDPRVSVRILKATEQSDGEYEDLLSWRAEVIAEANRLTAGLDAVLMPTVPITPPKLADLAEDAAYGRLNLLALRNPTVGNFLDRCAISLPIHEPGTAPVGLMLMGEAGADRALLSLARAVEAVL